MNKSNLSHLLRLFALSGLLALLTSSAHAWRVSIEDCQGCSGRAPVVVVDAAGDIITAGRVYYGGEIIKLSAETGKIIWQFNASHIEFEQSISALAIDSKGDVFVGFDSRRTVIKISGATGKRIWQKVAGGTRTACFDYISSIVVDRDDNVVTAGTSGCFFNVAKLDGQTGDQKWHYEREGYANAVAVDPFGNVAAAGVMNRNFAVVKLQGENGAELWQREINGAGNFTDIFDEARAVAMDKDGSVVAVGATNNEVTNFRDFTVAKYSPDGRVHWVEIINGLYRATPTSTDQSNDVANAVVIDKDGGVIAAGSVQEGHCFPPVGEREHFHVVKFSRNGKVLWSRPAEDPEPVPCGEREYKPGYAFSLSVNAFGNVVAGGLHGGRFTLVKFWGRTGGRAWRRQLSSGMDASENGNTALGVVMDAASDVIAAGEAIGADDLPKFTVVKLRRKDGLDYGDPPLPPFPPPDPSLTPVIFIPGIAGSRLNIPGTPIELWPGIYPPIPPSIFPIIAPHDSLGLNPKSPLCPLFPAPYSCYRPEVDVDGVIRESLPLRLKQTQFYKPLLDAFRRAGYVEDSTLFVFAYDWRKSNNENDDLLKGLVDRIRAMYPNSKVNIVAHSMGGILARRYIMDNHSSHNVDKLITIGTPFLGAPKVLLTLETGEFFEDISALLVKKSTLRTLVDFFPSAHELMPSKAYFDLGGRPFAEQGWDINDNGNSWDEFSYPQLITLYNNSHSSSMAGRNNLIFHSVPGQDDWSDRDYGVRYYHIYGIKPLADTIGQVVATQHSRCFVTPSPSIIRICLPPKQYFDVVKTRGDGTVPILSATRKGNGQDYAPNTKIIPIEGDKDKTEHLKLTQNPEVHRHIFSTLNPPPASSREEAAKVQNQADDAVAQQAYYLRLEGAASAELMDEAGNVSYPLNDAPDAGVVDVTSYLLGEDAFLSIMPTDDSYTLTFVTGESPVAIDLTKGTDVETAQAIRYLDLNLPANTAVRLEITPEGVGGLYYDSNGDGTFDSLITPTISVSGAAAQDTEPPAITFNEMVQPTTTLVSLNATDGGAGVRSLFYSLDGAKFQPYAGTLSLDPRQTPVVYAFAEDNVANRSSLFTHTLKQPTWSISGIVSEAGGNKMGGVTIMVTGAHTATTTTDVNGSYSFGSLPAGGSYTVVPSKTNYTFTPPNQTITNLAGNQTINFTAIANPILLTEENSTRAIALDSVTLWRDPFSLFTGHNFSSDQRTRIILFAVNVDLMAAENISVLTAQAEDSQQRIFPLTVEYIGKVPNFDWLTQVVVRLPDGLAGDVRVSINLRGVASNKALISIKP